LNSLYVFHSSDLFIRNARAALVMKYGIEPFYDSQASSYAYKMRI